MPNATLSFLPWVRHGAASAITAPDLLGAKQSAVVSIEPSVSLNGAPITSMAVNLRGPADVIGIDANQIVRTDPRPATNDFEPNCFPAVEFDRPDFPWLFTPAKANANTQLRPWLCLIVVRRQDGVTLSSTGETPLSTLRIDFPAQPAVELPDLTESWAWAHAQVAADDSTESSIATAFDGGPELTLSRLVCPRILEAETDYIACVVPTFEVGRKAGLGLNILDAELSSLAPAWSLTPEPAQALLPVYFHWEFRTGEQGDFESLALRLKTAAATGLGTRTIDVSQPGFPAGSVTSLELEGALLPIPASPPPPESDPLPRDFKQQLAAIVNEPSRLEATDPTHDPVLAPPLYGRWHMGQTAASPESISWFDVINLDPRWRVAAAFGTRVVQEHQEALMASAWDQAAAVQSANQRMRQMQLSLAVSERLHARHFNALTEEMMLRVAAPAFGRLKKAAGLSLLAAQTGSLLPVGANRSAMRRIGRQRGPLTRRIALKGFQRSATDTWVARLNNLWTGPGAPPPEPPPPPPPLPSRIFSQMPSLNLFTKRVHDTQSSFGVFFVAAENTPLPSRDAPVLAPKIELPDYFRSAAREHLESFFPLRPIVIKPHFEFFESIRSRVLEQTTPRVALATLARAVVSASEEALAPTAAGVTPVGVETIMAAPYFPQPMYEPLRDISQDLLLPGLDTVGPDTVLGLQTNRRFVETYMLGLNHEMGRELLWRGYPTDQRGTYFDHFWGLGVPNTAPRDIIPIHTWNTRPLGRDSNPPVSSEQFVMLIRSSLLLRYPNAVIYLTPAMNVSIPPNAPLLAPDETHANEKPPIFSGALHPDLAFFGFPVTTRTATGMDGGLGYYIIIQEHPTEPRFGLDVSLSLDGVSHLPIGVGPPPDLPPLNGRTWGKNSAEMAAITRRQPVRIAIHASRLITPA